jgi:Leucine-rich repeat (LRR) protein
VYLTRLPCLWRLDVGNNELSRLQLLLLPKLSCVRASHNVLDDSSVRIHECYDLEQLDISHNRINRLRVELVDDPSMSSSTLDGSLLGRGRLLDEVENQKQFRRQHSLSFSMAVAQTMRALINTAPPLQDETLSEMLSLLTTIRQQQRLVVSCLPTAERPLIDPVSDSEERASSAAAICVLRVSSVVFTTLMADHNCIEEFTVDSSGTTKASVWSSCSLRNNALSAKLDLSALTALTSLDLHHNPLSHLRVCTRLHGFDWLTTDNDRLCRHLGKMNPLTPSPPLFVVYEWNDLAEPL